MLSATLKAQIKYWHESAMRNMATAEDLLKTKHYDSCLFFCHLALEKELKSLVIQRTHQSAPYLHDLERLATLAGLDIDPEMRVKLRTISTFNIAARYDDVKLNFYKRCTKKYTEKYFKTSKEVYIWLKKTSQKT